MVGVRLPSSHLQLEVERRERRHLDGPDVCKPWKRSWCFGLCDEPSGRSRGGVETGSSFVHSMCDVPVLRGFKRWR